MTKVKQTPLGQEYYRRITYDLARALICKCKHSFILHCSDSPYPCCSEKDRDCKCRGFEP